MVTELFDTDALEEVLEGVVTIPTIPSTLTEINRILEDPDGSAKEAADVVARDPAVAAKVLRLVNSAYYGLKNPVGNIPFAVSILGLKVLKNLVVQATVLETFGQGGGVAGIPAEWLWDHSFKAAVAASRLARRAGDTVQMISEDAYTAGLIHDVGRIILADGRSAQFTRALMAARRGGKPLFQVERELFGFHHGAVGALLSERWRLSPRISKAILFHHEPERLAGGEHPEDRLLGRLLFAADALAHAGDEAKAPYAPPADPGPALESLGIPPEDQEEIAAAVKETRRTL